MLLFVRRDMMLVVVCFAPVLAGVFFKFAIPCIERMLIDWTGAGALLAPYYGLCDLLFAMLTPVMFCFAAAMAMLEEHDDYIQQYLFITTLGRKGYLISRIGLPAAIALVVTVVLLPVFKLTALSVLEVTFFCAYGRSAWGYRRIAHCNAIGKQAGRNGGIEVIGTDDSGRIRTVFCGV